VQGEIMLIQRKLERFYKYKYFKDSYYLYERFQKPKAPISRLVGTAGPTIL
jgi:hypothetical protein